MQQVKFFRLILCMAAIIFIARPFIGFSVTGQLQCKEETNLVVKIFSKRKPEFLEDAGAEFSQLLQVLRNRALDFQLTFNALLATLFIQLTAITALICGRKVYRLRPASPPLAPIYLLTRQLTI